jgi:hypothetical protein
MPKPILGAPERLLEGALSETRVHLDTDPDVECLRRIDSVSE